MKKQPTPPNEFCPECLSLKRKPNKDCKNHSCYPVKTDSITSLSDALAHIMVKNIANESIRVQSTSEGRSAQRYWYVQAQNNIARMIREYRIACNFAYKKTKGKVRKQIKITIYRSTLDKYVVATTIDGKKKPGYSIDTLDEARLFARRIELTELLRRPSPHIVTIEKT